MKTLLAFVLAVSCDLLSRGAVSATLIQRPPQSSPTILAEYRDLSSGTVVASGTVPDSTACTWLKELPRDSAGVAHFAASNRSKGLVAAPYRRGLEPVPTALLTGVISEFKNIGSGDEFIVRGGTADSLVVAWLDEIRNAPDLTTVVKVVEKGQPGGLLSASVGPRLCVGLPVTLRVVWGHMATAPTEGRPEVRLRTPVGTGTLVTDRTPDSSWVDQLQRAETEADLFELVRANQDRGIVSVEKLLKVGGLVHKVRTRYVP